MTSNSHITKFYRANFEWVTIIQTNFKRKIALDEVLTSKTYNGTAECVQQDQTARTCSLILLYTLRKVNPCS